MCLLDEKWFWCLGMKRLDIITSEVSDIWCCSVDGGGDGYLQLIFSFTSIFILFLVHRTHKQLSPSSI